MPFHADIYTLSGYGVMKQRYGEEFSYDLNSRAKIFRRDQARVTSLTSLKRIMRYNSKCYRVWMVVCECVCVGVCVSV